ncbi:MAG: hypothetical protein V1735_06640 [Nanoarchaeota archaeon]
MPGVMLCGERNRVVSALHGLAAAHPPQVIFIDSANCFDPHLLFRRFGAEAYELLERIRISRPFTASQLVSALHQARPLMGEKTLLIVSSLDVLLVDLPAVEQRRALADIEGLLSHLPGRIVVGRFGRLINSRLFPGVVIDGQDSAAAAQHRAAAARRAPQVPACPPQGRPGAF